MCIVVAHRDSSKDAASAANFAEPLSRCIPTHASTLPSQSIKVF
ncbi:predicted protein [Plenodomus lingam JN3]|uniref:Predicted protein n=1 Tax=Leptosphaeria maculans (strain JN3 / isolate v23.1.3 / race Av1-4-5-6-7-8) TaxID=985895 RepID=E5R4Z3_LEPMJ|nr:predicted protein [Plenodomus lingam JN3]CBX92266.1 predicted protein [Plenodomus lingam JN3]